jgi:hypothetical protein
VRPKKVLGLSFQPCRLPDRLIARRVHHHDAGQALGRGRIGLEQVALDEQPLLRFVAHKLPRAAPRCVFLEHFELESRALPAQVA